MLSSMIVSVLHWLAIEFQVMGVMGQAIEFVARWVRGGIVEPRDVDLFQVPDQGAFLRRTAARNTSPARCNRR